MNRFFILLPFVFLLAACSPAAPAEPMYSVVVPTYDPGRARFLYPHPAPSAHTAAHHGIQPGLGVAARG